MQRIKLIISRAFLLTLPLIAQAMAQDPYLPSQSCLKEYQLNNFEQALASCLLASKENDPQAQYVMGMLYKRGKGVKQSPHEAMKWLTLAADNGYAAAQLKLGKILCTLTEPDYVKAFDYFLSAAHQNVTEAQFFVALYYQNGLVVAKNSLLALQWYNKAVANGLNGPMLAVEENIETHPIASQPHFTTPERFVALKLAADQGSAQAQFEVAMHYLTGQVTDQDDAQALSYLQAAAQQDNQSAKSFLAWMSMLGLGTTQNMQEAIYYFASGFDDSIEKPLSLSAKSQQEAQDQTTLLYDQAIKLLEDTNSDNQKQGIVLLTHAANRNHVPAQLRLAKAYQTGEGVPQNITQAAKWFEKAGHNGNSDAQYILGWLYFNGEGVSKDPSVAYFWFDKASLYGGAKAKSAKKFVQAQLVPVQEKKQSSYAVKEPVFKKLLHRFLKSAAGKSQPKKLAQR